MVSSPETPKSPVAEAAENGIMEVDGASIVGSINIDLMVHPDHPDDVQIIMLDGGLPKQVVVDVLSSALDHLRQTPLGNGE